MIETTAAFAALAAIARAIPGVPDKPTRSAKPPGAAAAEWLVGLYARFRGTLRVRRQRRDEAAVARLVRLNGGVLTDDLERRIARAYGRLPGDW